MDASSTPAPGLAAARRTSVTVPVYAGTLFLSAFLLFGIQPMFAKMVLPKLGGSPGVWSVAMVFFQTALLAGYGYAHWLVGRFSVRRAALIHLALMAGVLLVGLPIGIAAGFERPPQEGETLWLIALFTASVGLPFFAVAANGPLLQAWFARSGHPRAADPYFLYAASNIGSFLALIAYPFLVEPVLTLSLQSLAWSWGFGLLLAAIAACAGLAIGGGENGVAVVRALSAPAAVTGRQKLGWVALAFVPSGLLVAVTAHLSTDVASVPLLWVVPLALFLLTFVIVFQSRPLLRHGWMLTAHLVFVAALILKMLFQWTIGLGGELALHLGLFFTTAMVAHGELARRRPDAANLTGFYLWMSLGGVLGGLFCGLLAPLLFNSVVEYPILIVAGLLCRPGFTSIRMPGPVRAGLAGAVVVGLIALVVTEQQRSDSVRSFFGVNRIVDSPDGRFRVLVHGSTVHGAQRLRQDDGSLVAGRPEALSYYYTGGGIADGIDAVRRRRGGTLQAVAAIGLGTGSLACQTRPGENWTFFEIDPQVARMATDPARFSFMSICAPGARIVLGDARLTLSDAAPASLDLIVVDAFSSDAIPVHLMTTEAIALYQSKLRPGGAILFHISNRNMDLGPIVTATAHARGLSTWIRLTQQTVELTERRKYSPHVAIVARHSEDLGLPAEQGWVAQPGPGAARAWRDDYADVIGAIWRKLAR
ncbi:fused MFS/spermidine synthase [Bosea sp. R86505]|uniref:fused MFS/spermidine synthase n=1 Tax=Bosea sp. R86505 TaxID=3101710 RepID=UPI00366CE63B